MEAKLKKKGEVQCWGTGRPRREFLHVEDLAEAALFVLEKWDINSDSAPRTKNGDKLSFLNVGTGKDISIKELALLISNIFEYEGKIYWDHSKPDGTPKKLLDISRIKKMGWVPKIEFKDGLRSTIEVYKREFKIT